MGEVTHDITKRFEISQIRQEGLKIETTIDHDRQSKIASHFAPAIDEVFPDTSGDIEGCLLAVNPQNGAVIAIQGGKDFTKSQFNRCRSIQRPLGELPLPLLAAMRLSQDANLLTPLLSGDSHDFTILDLLTSPTPDLSAALYETIGSKAFRQHAKDMNLNIRRFDIGAVFGLAKGSPLSVAAGYAALTGQGIAYPPHLINQIKDSFGQSRYKVNTSIAKQVFSAKAAFATRYALNQLSPKHLVFSTVANDLRDAWLVASSPDMLYIYWFGSEHGTSRLGRSSDEVKARVLSVHHRMPPLLQKTADAPPPGTQFFRTALPQHGNQRYSVPR
jgi:membrane peptidoglycan carboxypeptidase